MADDNQGKAPEKAPEAAPAKPDTTQLVSETKPLAGPSPDKPNPSVVAPPMGFVTCGEDTSKLEKRTLTPTPAEPAKTEKPAQKPSSDSGKG